MMNIRRELAFWAQVTGFPQTVRFLKAIMFERWQHSSRIRLASSDQRYRQMMCTRMVWPSILATCRTCPLRAAQTATQRSCLSLPAVDGQPDEPLR